MPKNKLYVIFDARDSSYYHSIKAWLQDEDIAFCNDSIPSDSSIGKAIPEKISKANCCLFIVSENSKLLGDNILTELNEVCIKQIPIIALNVNGMRHCDTTICPIELQDKFILHIPLNQKVIIKALEVWPTYYSANKAIKRGSVYFTDNVYQKLGL